MTKIDMKEIYRDQCIVNTRTPGFQFGFILLPLGIKNLDSLFGHRIRACKRGETYTEYINRYTRSGTTVTCERVVEQVWDDTYESLEKDIKKNPHLHKLIKKNLLYNLKHYE